MRSLWKQALLCTVLIVTMVVPAWAAGGPASSPSVGQHDAFFLSLQNTPVTNGACKNPATLPDDQCSHINGLACSPEGAQISCYRSNGQISHCLCQASCHWACIF